MKLRTLRQAGRALIVFVALWAAFAPGRSEAGLSKMVLMPPLDESPFTMLAIQRVEWGPDFRIWFVAPLSIVATTPQGSATQYMLPFGWLPGAGPVFATGDKHAWIDAYNQANQTKALLGFNTVTHLWDQQINYQIQANLGQYVPDVDDLEPIDGGIVLSESLVYDPMPAPGLQTIEKFFTFTKVGNVWTVSSIAMPHLRTFGFVPDSLMTGGPAHALWAIAILAQGLPSNAPANRLYNITRGPNSTWTAKVYPTPSQCSQTSITSDAGATIWMADDCMGVGNDRILKLPPGAVSVSAFSLPAFSAPRGIAFGGGDGNLYFSETPSTVAEMTPLGQMAAVITGNIPHPCRVTAPPANPTGQQTHWLFFTDCTQASYIGRIHLAK